MFGAGASFDELLDRLHDAGYPVPMWGRAPGQHNVRLHGTGPNGGYDYIGPSLDSVARGVIDCELSCGDKERDAARAKAA